MSERISAAMFCREALLHFTRELQIATESKIAEPPHLARIKDPSKRIYYANIALTDDEMQREIDYLSSHFIIPCMTLFARRLRKINLGNEFMELPAHYDAANELFHNVAMRTVISDKMPIGDQLDLKGKGVVKQYYDITTDSLKTGECINSILFSVHEVGVTVKR